MFENLEEKKFNYWHFILYIVLGSILFAISSSFFSGSMNWNDIIFLSLVPMGSAFLGMSLTYYFVNNKSFKSIAFNKLVLVAILGLVPSIIIGISLTYLSAILI